MILVGLGLLLIGLGLVGFWFLRIDFRLGRTSDHAWVGLISWWWWTDREEEYDRSVKPGPFWATFLFNLIFYLALVSAGAFSIYLSQVKP